MAGSGEIDCREALDRLYEYLDDELTPERAAEVRAHLEACADCFALSNFENAYLRFLRARAEAQQAPPNLRKRILREVFLGEDGQPEGV